ncbi:unnamed protein product [Brassica oleracea var. botrytis]|uniref:Uncharacterized protein n=1 Tax=Brassica oleracea var. oleracea TaxID=109376 RepID=A0A0D3CS41_BRAOL
MYKCYISLIFLDWWSGRVRTAEIPTKCWCGAGITELMDDNHVFKWVDEAFTEEIQKLDYQARMLEEEVQALKATIRSEAPKIRPKIRIVGGSLIIPIVSIVVALGIWMYKS